MGLDDGCLWVEMKLPDVLQQHGARNDAPGTTHEILQELELLRLHIDFLTRPRDASFQEIELQVGDTQERLDFGRRRPARESIHPGQQLGESKRLEEIIVPAGFEALYAIVNAAKRHEKQ